MRIKYLDTVAFDIFESRLRAWGLDGDWMVNEEAKGNVGFPFLVREQKYKRK